MPLLSIIYPNHPENERTESRKSKVDSRAFHAMDDRRPTTDGHVGNPASD